MAGRAGNRFLELSPFPEVRRERTHFADRVDRLLVRDTRLPGAEFRESIDATHAQHNSTQSARPKQARLRTKAGVGLQFMRTRPRGRYARNATPNPEPRTPNPRT